MKNLTILILLFCFLQNNTALGQMRQIIELPMEVFISKSESDSLFALNIIQIEPAPFASFKFYLSNPLQDTSLVVQIDSISVLKMNKKGETITFHYANDSLQIDGNFTMSKCPVFYYENQLNPETFTKIAYMATGYVLFPTGWWISMNKKTKEETTLYDEVTFPDQHPCPEIPKK